MEIDCPLYVLFGAAELAIFLISIRMPRIGNARSLLSAAACIYNKIRLGFSYITVRRGLQQFVGRVAYSLHRRLLDLSTSGEYPHLTRMLRKGP